MTFSLAHKKIWVAGHSGMVGSAVVRRLASENCQILQASRQHVDLRRQQDVEDWMQNNKPDVIILAAATVGGIHANSTRPAEFIYDNLIIESNIIHSAHQLGVQKLLFLGSSCIYPKLASQPIDEDALLTGPLEPTNEWYAVAKIAGIKLCQAYRQQHGADFISAMPTNLYGPGDTYSMMQSHVIPGLLHRVHGAKEKGDAHVAIWGTGKPRREFLYVDDLADALIFLLHHYSDARPINVGTGQDLTIKELAELIAKTVQFDGKFVFNTDKPDGTPRKLLDVSKLQELGWSASTPLDLGIKKTYESYLNGNCRKL